MKENIAKYIDATLLKADATEDDIRNLCQKAKEYNVASVCVNSYWVPLVHSELRDSDIKTCAVVGFPLGACSTYAKSTDAVDAIWNGADEIDMVMNIGEAKAGHWKNVESDIRAVTEIIHNTDYNAILKVIIETCLLTDDEKIEACKVIQKAGADFVKTSTGFSTGGATVEDIKLLRKTVGNNLKIKASGGIRDYQTAMDMIHAGADRLGVSHLDDILKQ